MRNLKRVLSLGLASVMLIGMMVMGAGAADVKASDLTDMDKVTNKEAVSLMVDLGIIVGKPDGSFAPAETVDRATMSKLIYFVMMGKADENAFKGLNTGLTDVKGNWAEGFINYCYSVGIVAGTGNNTYNPNGKVTVASAAKMLLVALGYDAKDRGYENNNMWSINIMKDAQSNGLLAGISQSATDEMTRDNAAQMIFNALFAKTVTPKYSYDQGNKYVSDYEKGNALGVNSFNLAKVTGTVTAISNGKATFASVTADPASANDATALGVVNNKLVATPNMVGSAVTAYVKTKGVGGVADTLYSTSLTIAKSNTLGSSYDGTSIAKLTNSSDDKYIASLGATVTYFVNGDSKTLSQAEAAIKIGSVVDLIDTNNNGDVDSVRIINNSIGKLTADASTKTSGSATQVKVPGVVNTFTDVSKVVGYEGLKKDDIVLYVVMGGVTYLEKAESVSGVVAGLHSTKGLLLDGTYYKDSALTGATNSWKDTSDDYTNTYKFFLDNGKNIVYADKVTDEATSANYAVILEATWVTGSTLDSSNFVQAKLLFSDGTTQVVKISSVDGFTPVKYDASLADDLYYWNGSSAAKTATSKAAAKTFYYTASGTTVKAKYFGVNSPADLTASVDGLKNTTTKTDSKISFLSLNSFYAYSTDSEGNYVLKTADNTASKITTDSISASTEIKGNTAVFATGKAPGNSSTVFVVALGNAVDGYTYKTYTGISNLPNIAAGKLTSGHIVAKNGIATYVYLNSSEVSTADKDYVYITSTDYTYVPKNGSTPAHYAYSAIVNGEPSTVKALDNTTVFTAKGIYSGTLDSNGIYTKATQETTVVGIKVVSGGTLILDNAFKGETTFTYTDDSIAYVIDGTDVSSPAVGSLSVDKTDLVFIKTTAGSTTKVDTIFVIKQGTPKASAVVASATGATVTPNDLLDHEDHPVAVTAATAGDTFIVTATPQGGAKATVTISGTGTTVTATSANANSDAAANYVLVAGDSNKTLTVTVTTFMDNEAEWTATYVIALPAIAPAP